MEFYPYDLYISKYKGAGIDGLGFSLGFSTTEKESNVFFSKCRDYASGSGSIINTETKEATNYSSVIMLPLDCADIQAGVLVEVRDKSGKTRLSSRAIRFERNQLHCRLWV